MNGKWHPGGIRFTKYIDVVVAIVFAVFVVVVVVVVVVDPQQLQHQHLQQQGEQQSHSVSVCFDCCWCQCERCYTIQRHSEPLTPMTPVTIYVLAIVLLPSSKVRELPKWAAGSHCNYLTLVTQGHLSGRELSISVPLWPKWKLLPFSTDESNKQLDALIFAPWWLIFMAAPYAAPLLR